MMKAVKVDPSLGGLTILRYQPAQQAHAQSACLKCAVLQWLLILQVTIPMQAKGTCDTGSKLV